MLRVFGGLVGGCLAFLLVFPPLALYWWLIIHLAYIATVDFPRRILLVPGSYLAYWLVKVVFSIPAGFDYHKNFPLFTPGRKLLCVSVAEGLFLASASLMIWAERSHNHFWDIVPWMFFCIWYLPFADFMVQLVKEEASRDNAQLVQHKMLFKERELIPPFLQGPFPPAPEWLRTAPHWVGKTSEENPRYRFWRGFLDTALHVVRWFAWIDKKGKEGKPLGDAHVASVNDTYEAGL